MPLFEDLTEILLQYKDSNSENRRVMLDATIQKVMNLPADVTTNKEAMEAYTTMAYATQIIQYAENLRKIENQEFFEILSDYADMEARFKKTGNEFLNAYFEFKSAGIGAGRQAFMRLKKPLNEYTPEIWDKFHEEQCTFLTETKRTWAQITKGVAYDSHLVKGQLYPLPQMLGALENNAVDKIVINNDGQFHFVETVVGHPQLPAGGMARGASKGDYSGPMKQMLNEFLEEENGNLYQTAAEKFIEIPQDEFKKELIHCINMPELSTLADYEHFKKVFLDATHTESTNDIILKTVIHCIDAYQLTGDDNAQRSQSKIIHSLRAAVQLETFKLHGMYQEAFNYIKQNSTAVEISQVNDLRRAGGGQMSTTFMMQKPLEDFFREQGITQFDLGDDMTGGKYLHLTMLDVLHRDIRFSHKLIALSCQLECLKNNSIDFQVGWDKQSYAAVKNKILANKNLVLFTEHDKERFKKSEALSKIDLALESLHSKIKEMGTPCSEAQTKAQVLYETLKKTKKEYETLLLTSEHEPHRDTEFVEAGKKFKDKCVQAINEAMPVLEKEVDWREFLKTVSNAVSYSAPVSGKSSFFNQAQSGVSPKGKQQPDEGFVL